LEFGIEKINKRQVVYTIEKRQRKKKQQNFQTGMKNILSIWKKELRRAILNWIICP